MPSACRIPAWRCSADGIFPFLKQFDTKIIVNVCGHAPEEYLEVVERLAAEEVDLLEINISCPNVNAGFLAFGQDPKHVEALTAEIKKKAKQPVIMKLTPNVTDIAEIARAAEAGGADAVSLINTLTGMKIDVKKRCFALANKTGGMSGPAVKPVAVRMVYQTAQAVKIPVNRHGRHRSGGGCPGVYPGRSHGGFCGHRQLLQSCRHSGNHRGDPAVHGGKPGGGYPGTHRSGPVKETAIGQIWRF